MSLVQAGDNVRVFRAFAKAHGLAALSPGYASAPRTWAEHRRKQGLGFPRDQNGLAPIADAASLRDTAHMVRVNTVSPAGLNAATMGGVKCSHPEWVVWS